MEGVFWLVLASIPLLLYVYVRSNDAKLSRLPPEAAAFSKERWSPKVIQTAYESITNSPPSLLRDELPPKTGRRYIVVGGAGFLGGWIVLHLLERGEDPRRIRVLDIRPPSRKDLTEGPARDVDYVVVDVTDVDAVHAAFARPWPAAAADLTDPNPELTVFHTAATIRFFERHPALQPLSDKVNVQGTQNVLDAARRAGAATFVYTSSGSISVRRSWFWLWPWEREPKHFTQVITDDDAGVPTRHEHFFSNYAVSKREAEMLVRRADRAPSGAGEMRTGCIRPGNGVYGPGGDLLVGMYLTRRANQTWIGRVLQSFIYVENCSLAHLCYEARLIEQRGTRPGVGGQAFCVADRGAPPTYGDIYRALTQLTRGATSFAHLSPTAMLALAHLFETYHLARHVLTTALPALARVVPPLGGDVVFLQPSMFALTQVHLIFDDSRARLPPEEGGLGYHGCTSLEGVCKVVLEHERTDGRGWTREIAGHRVDKLGDAGAGVARAENGVDNLVERVERKVGLVN
ncbi:NAD(P)-binding protein [Obba rivulosa]|uniref:NAD(P)-binding protein n=1 Tax=Obba rivulosa TaxID=1052685 RepID=A0A8E2B184_9APHY|nr:NAD(P)-binding protein [Obba rivulosa]